MHPLLASYRRLIAYLLVWAPILVLLAWLTPETPGRHWPAAVALLAPVCVLYAFFCLSPWPICRAWPLRPGNLEGLVATWIAASAIGGLILAAAGLKQFGTEAAGRLLADPEQLGAILRKLSRGWESRNLQVVLHARVIGNTPALPDVVASYVW